MRIETSLPFARPLRAAAAEPQAEPQPRPPRAVARLAARTAGWSFGLFNAVTGLPQGMVASVMARRGADPASIKKALAVTQLVSSVVPAAAAGALLGGPAGLIVGAAAGYLGGTLSNYMESRSQQFDHLLEDLQKGQRGPILGTLKSVGQSMAIGWAQGNVGGSAFTAGMLEGFRWESTSPPAPAQPRSLLERASSLLFGAAGVLINGPAGAVLGAMEPSPTPSRLTRHLLLLATNLGKVLPGVLIGAMFPGPVGILAGTAVGLLTASITSMVDGRGGVHPELVGRVSRQVEASHGQEECPDNARVFHRAGKGMIVGLKEGMRAGWEVGTRSGVQIVRDGLFSPEAVIQDEK